MADHVKEPLLSTLQSCKGFTFFSDETTDVRRVEQLAIIYATFCYNNVVSEHFIGLLPLSKIESSFTAPNIMKVIENFFGEKNISLRKARFACMDNTNVNSGEKGGLKKFLEDLVPMLIWVGCNNHKIAYSFKHMLPKFNCVFAVDVFLLNLWKYFHYRSLELNFLENAADVYGVGHLVPVCPSVTRWTAHERACHAFHTNYQPFLSALAVGYNERKEAEALGLFIQSASPVNAATILLTS